MKKHIVPKLFDALQAMCLNYDKEFRFYFFFLNYVDFYEWEAMPSPRSMAVTVKNMRLALIYHPEFVETHTENELIAVLIHEVKHLLHNHLERGKHYDKQMANIAMDMIINHLIATYHTKVKLPAMTEERLADLIVKAEAAGEKINEEAVAKLRAKFKANESVSSCVVLDANYKGDLVFEPLFKWLKDNKEKEDKGEKNELSEDTKDLLKRCGDGMSTDYHMPSDELMEEIKKQLGQEAMEKVKVAQRGFGSNSIEQSMQMLLKPPANNNLRILKRVIAAHKGQMKSPSYRRLNRRVMGLKGDKKVSQSINVGLDVSGSMYGSFDVVLSEIFRDGFAIDLVQVDTKIQRIDKIKDKKQLKNFMIQGLGGTVLQPFVDYVLDAKNKLLQSPTIILTDGDCDHLDFRGSSHQFLILSCRTEVQYKNGFNVKQIIIKP